MTKKDYIKIAAVLKEANRVAGNCRDHEALQQCKACVKLITHNIAVILEEDNNKFDLHKFMEACGL